MRSHRGRLPLVLLVLLAHTPSPAQRPEEMLTRYRRAWHDQNGVYLKLNTTIRIERTKDGLVATKTTEHEQLALKAPAGLSDREEVGYSGLVPLSGMNAWTMVPKDNGYKKVVVSDFTHKDELSGRIFHDDSRIVQFLFPGVAPGAIKHLEYTLDYPDARLVTGHYFATNYPVEESTLTVIADKDVEVDARTFHVPEGMLKHERDESRGRVVQRWTMTKVPPLQFESDAPGFRYYTPHVQLVLRKAGQPATGPDGDLQRMFAWDLEHVRGVMADDDTTLTRIAREAAAGLADDSTKAARLYAWVQDHIKYVAMEDGMNGLIPAKAADVCAARYGDCKGMANLLRALMGKAGLKACLAWVGSRELPYRYDELPSPVVDDHMITAWDRGNGRFLLLDPTSDETPFGMPSAFIQGKQALIAVDSTRYAVMDVPVMPSTANTLTDTVYAHLDGTTLRGRGISHYTGYLRTTIAGMLRRVERQKWAEALRSIHMKGNNRFQIDSVDVIGLDDRNTPLVLTYSFSIPGFANKLGDDLYLPAILEKPFADRYYRKGRKLPVEEDFCWEQREILLLDLGPGIVPTHLPEEADHQGPDFGYDLHAIATGTGDTRRIRVENHYRMGRLLLQEPDFDPWRAMLDQLDRDMNRSIVLAPPRP